MRAVPAPFGTATVRSPGAGCARRPRRGFTLLETGLALVIVGVGVLALVSAQAAFHQKNNWASHASLGTYLGNEIREMTWNLPQHDPVTGTFFWGPEGDNEASFLDYDDLDDFDGADEGVIFSAALGNGPINARREVIPNMDGWSQTVRVFNLDPFDVAFDPESLDGVVDNFTTDFLAVEVTVAYQGPRDPAPVEITRVSWIAPH